MLDSKIQPDADVFYIADVLCEAAKLAYEHSVRVGKEWLYDNCREVGADVKYRVLSTGDVGIIAIAGSDSFADFLKFNADTKQHTVGDYTVHRGFAAYADTLLADLKSIDDLPECFANGAYFIAGHSLGSAAAGLLPILLEAKPSPKLEQPMGVFGVGVPNFLIGDSAAKYQVKNAVFISSRWDVVSRVPLGTFRRKYCKPNAQYWVDDDGFSNWDGNQVTRLLWYAFKGALMFAQRSIGMKPSLKSLHEHNLGVYLSRIKNGLLKMEGK